MWLLTNSSEVFTGQSWHRMILLESPGCLHVPWTWYYTYLREVIIDLRLLFVMANSTLRLINQTLWHSWIDKGACKCARSYENRKNFNPQEHWSGKTLHLYMPKKIHFVKSTKHGQASVYCRSHRSLTFQEGKQKVFFLFFSNFLVLPTATQEFTSRICTLAGSQRWHQAMDFSVLIQWHFWTVKRRSEERWNRYSNQGCRWDSIIHSETLERLERHRWQEFLTSSTPFC